MASHIVDLECSCLIRTAFFLERALPRAFSRWISLSLVRQHAPTTAQHLVPPRWRSHPRNSKRVDPGCAWLIYSRSPSSVLVPFLVAVLHSYIRFRCETSSVSASTTTQYHSRYHLLPRPRSLLLRDILPSTYRSQIAAEQALYEHIRLQHE
jgi:hypothetical protein